MKLAIAQINTHVGAIEDNTQLVLAQIEAAEQAGAELVVFPELVLTGYPPEDLLLRPSLQKRIDSALNTILPATHHIGVVLGYPRMTKDGLKNCAGFLFEGEIVTEYFKRRLPNYEVFDECRYFTPGKEDKVFEFKGQSIALTVCEDIWHDNSCRGDVFEQADFILNLSASPFHQNKQSERIELLQQRQQEAKGTPIVYTNLVGGQDELVFDGGSIVLSAAGKVHAMLPQFEEAMVCVDMADNSDTEQLELKSELACMYDALVLGVRDYVNKNGFPSVVLGLSGGIDSALTLAIAVDALGADRVSAVMMPFRYTSEMSIQDAAEEAKILGVDYKVISIEGTYDAFMTQLQPHFEGRAADTAEQNIQARARGVMLMALSNKLGSLVLTTGNKSEVAVGYSTLYGDMAGGLDVLKDVLKTKVYALSNYRNTLSRVIPERVITRPPSAELAPDQKDEDNLPAYDILDQILYRYVDCDESFEVIVAAGFNRDDVYRVIRLVDINEYKRRQAPVGIRLSRKGFGRDRRYPITNGWRPGM